MDILNEILVEIPRDSRLARPITEAYSALFEDAASTATHRTKKAIRSIFTGLASTILDDVAKDANGRPILTISGKTQTYLEYLERNIRNNFFHDGANQKFEPGVARIAYGELNMDTQLEHGRALARLKSIVKLISDGHANEYDHDLNGLSYHELENRFGAKTQDTSDQLRNQLASMEYNPSDYTIVPIPDFGSAKAFYKYTNPDSRWCITHMKNMWDSYTANGLNKVYFACKPDFKKTERVAGKKVPLDEYGLSLISIIVDPWGNLRAVTTRWNHEKGGSDRALNAMELSSLLGGNVFDLCPPGQKPQDHIERIDEDSVRIGDQIWLSHNLRMPADPENGIYVFDGESYFSIDAAMRVAKKYGKSRWQLKGPWRLPTFEDWMKLVNYCGGEGNAGIHLKSQFDWKCNPGFDTYGFNVLPFDWYHPKWKQPASYGNAARFWSSTPYPDARIGGKYFVLFTTVDNGCRFGPGSNEVCLSVRLVRDAD